MRLYSSAYLAFGCTISRHLENWLDSGTLKDFNCENGSDLGHIKVGSFEDNQLYLVTFCEGVEPNEPERMSLEGSTRKERMTWRRQLLAFLRQYEITNHGEIGMWLLADLDN